MSKKKARRRRPHTPPLSAKDIHHACFQGRHWNSGYAKSIRGAFARPVPIVWHRELHSKLSDVPLPPADMLKQAWLDYQKDKWYIDSMGVCQAIAWLYVHIPDVEFRKAMQYQLDFFSVKYEETV